MWNKMNEAKLVPFFIIWHFSMSWMYVGPYLLQEEPTFTT